MGLVWFSKAILKESDDVMVKNPLWLTQPFFHPLPFLVRRGKSFDADTVFTWRLSPGHHSRQTLGFQTPNCIDKVCQEGPMETCFESREQKQGHSHPQNLSI